MNNMYNNNHFGWENAAYATAANTYKTEPYPRNQIDYGGDGMVYAMAYVRTQPWGELYDDETALKRGTIFPVLDFPWIGEGGGSAL